MDPATGVYTQLADILQQKAAFQVVSVVKIALLSSVYKTIVIFYLNNKKKACSFFDILRN